MGYSDELLGVSMCVSAFQSVSRGFWEVQRASVELKGSVSGSQDQDFKTFQWIVIFRGLYILMSLGEVSGGVRRVSVGFLNISVDSKEVVQN